MAKPGLDRNIDQGMRSLGVRPEEIRESFIRSSGPGGQNVNKTATCVYLKHIPTGIEVKCQGERTQAQNRLAAWKILLGKIRALVNKKEAEQRSLLEKKKRQFRKKPLALKLRILEGKRRHSQKKSLRAKIHDTENA